MDTRGLKPALRRYDNILHCLQWARNNFGYDKYGEPHSEGDGVIQAVRESCYRWCTARGWSPKEMDEREKSLFPKASYPLGRPQPALMGEVMTPEIENLIAIYEVHRSLSRNKSR